MIFQMIVKKRQPENLDEVKKVQQLKSMKMNKNMKSILMRKTTMIVHASVVMICIANLYLTKTGYVAKSVICKSK